MGFLVGLIGGMVSEGREVGGNWRRLCFCGGGIFGYVDLRSSYGDVGGLEMKRFERRGTGRDGEGRGEREKTKEGNAIGGYRREREGKKRETNNISSTHQRL